MHRSLIVLPLLCALGCVKSKQPFYLPEDAVFSEILLGEWTAQAPPQTRFGIEKGEVEPSRRQVGGELVPTQTRFRIKKGEGKTLVLAAENSTPEGTIQLFRLGDHCFWDLLHSPAENAKERFHTLCKVSLIGDDLFCRSLNPDWLKPLLQRNPKAIAHADAQSSPARIRLTASTKELQAFIGKYIEDPRAFKAAGQLSVAKETAVAEEGFGSRRQRTLDYWYELCMKVRNPEVVRWDANALPRALSSVADQLESLVGNKGVDAEAAACAKETAAIFRRTVELEKYFRWDNDLTAKMTVRFLRAAATAPLTAAKELVEDARLKEQGARVVEQIDNTIEHLEKARATLSKRYEVKLMELR
jgi:hypothetical protein